MWDYWTIKPGQGFGSLTLSSSDSSAIEKHQVRVRIRATSINARDAMVAMGHSPMPVADELIPLSDGAGIVEEIGEEVTRVKVGDRVVITFNPAHQEGPYLPVMAKDALGELRSGLLCSETIIEEHALVILPDNISFEQAACLPCVAVTAWNALFEAGPTKPGQTILVTGTGMVSLTAMLLAKAAGLRVGITTSDNSKTDELKAFGADFVVNYRDHSNWGLQVKSATDGQGADIVIETAGPPSIAQSIKAAAQNGRVMQIGFKAPEGPAIDVLDLLIGGVSVVPIMVGSRAMLQRLVQAVSVHNIQLPIQKRFDFQDVPEAFESYLRSDGFGKIVISSTSKS